MAARYALYFAPERDCLLWQLGCRWLSRDPEQDLVLSPPPVPAFDAERLQALTESPRMYGFHATLKPPFGLRAGHSESDLLREMDAFCARRAVFLLPSLEVASLSRFLALRPATVSPELQALADDCVTEFDYFRQRAGEDELGRRRAAGLSGRQEELLTRYGYPYVLDQFRFHLTLTERLAEADADRLIPFLQDYFRDALREPVRVAGLCLFVQDHPDAPFRLGRRLTFPH